MTQEANVPRSGSAGLADFQAGLVVTLVALPLCRFYWCYNRCVDLCSLCCLGSMEPLYSCSVWSTCYRILAVGSVVCSL